MERREKMLVVCATPTSLFGPAHTTDAQAGVYQKQVLIGISLREVAG